MIESEFDLAEWIKRFPVEEFGQERCGGAVTSPIDAAIVEQVRSLASGQIELGPSVPTDIFIFGAGEPDRRDVTKVNGLPYRPAGLPWPLRADGEPMTFLCQYRFTESKDIIGELPGDVMLVFVIEKGIYLDEGVFHFEWYPLGLTDLIQACDVPKPSWEFVTCYGVRHRSVDYVDADDTVSNSISKLISLERASARSVARWGAMKIGGLVMWHWDGAAENYHRRHASRLPGRFLCALSDIQPALDVPYPWLNRAEPIADSGADSSLLFRDGSIIHFVISDDGKVDWYVQFA